jgi:hypothetical protein
MQAVEDYGLDYATLKRLARNSLEYSFAEGGSLWMGYDYGKMTAACAEPASVGCTSFLAANTKARIEWRLEQRLREFEGKWK